MTKKYPKHYTDDSILKSLDADLKEGIRYIGRLRTCNATVYQTKDESCFYLMSYGTYVACIDTFLDTDGFYTSECSDFLRVVYGYTTTSAQHIRKFFEDYGETRQIEYRYDIDDNGVYYQRIR